MRRGVQDGKVIMMSVDDDDGDDGGYNGDDCRFLTSRLSSALSLMCCLDVDRESNSSP